MWSKGNTPLLLVGMQTYTTTLEISMAVSQKIGHQPTSGHSNTTRTYTKGCVIILQGQFSTYAHKALFVIASTLKQPKRPQPKTNG